MSDSLCGYIIYKVSSPVDWPSCIVNDDNRCDTHRRRLEATYSWGIFFVFECTGKSNCIHIVERKRPIHEDMFRQHVFEFVLNSPDETWFFSIRSSATQLPKSIGRTSIVSNDVKDFIRVHGSDHIRQPCWQRRIRMWYAVASFSNARIDQVLSESDGIQHADR